MFIINKSDIQKQNLELTRELGMARVVIIVIFFKAS